MSWQHESRWLEENRLFLPLLMETGNKRKSSWRPPRLSDGQLEYLSFLLEEAHELKRPVIVTFAGRRSPLQFCGRVTRIQPYEGWFVIANGELKKLIHYRQLIDVYWM
jgi:hypothetical protein